MNADYKVFCDKEPVFNILLRNINRSPTEISVYYVDITEDGRKDIVMIGEPPSGTNPSPYWSYAYDMFKKKELSLFDAVSGDLTEKQKVQLETLLKEDKEFQALFPDYSYLGGTRPYVDEFGKVYYELAIWGDDINMNLGQMLILFDYNSEEGEFDVVDFLYIPHLVGIESEK